MSSISSGGGDRQSQSIYDNPGFHSDGDSSSTDKVRQTQFSANKSTPPTRQQRQNEKDDDNSSRSNLETKQSQDNVQKEKQVKPSTPPPPPPTKKPIWKRFLTRRDKDKQQPQIKSQLQSMDEKEKKITHVTIPASSSDSGSASEQDEENPPMMTKRKQKQLSPPPTKENMLKSIKEKENKLKDDVKLSDKKRGQHLLKMDTGENSSESETEDDDETTVIQKTPKKNKTNKKQIILKHSDDEEENEDELLFGITIHGSDMLPIDSNALHPLVKVTLMTQEGKYVTKKDDQTKSPNNVTRKQSKRHKNSINSTGPQTILPIMTQSFPFQFNTPNPTLTPAWEELLLFDEPLEQFLRENPSLIIFFEIMDFLPMAKTSGQSSHDKSHGTEIGWYKVGWAYLKPVASNGARNTDERLRLQLFKPVKLRAREILDGLPEVYSWWKCGRQKKMVNTTLYVTVKGVCPPKNSKLSQLLSMRKDELTHAMLEHQLSKSSKKSRRKKTLEIVDLDARRNANWSRLEGQSCKVPNKLMLSLPSSPIESLNLTISGNVHCVKFSPCGLKLAAGLDTEDLHAVLLFDIPSGNLLRSLKNHHGLIYDLSWKEVDNSSSYIQYLASASADSTACIWSMKNGNEATLKCVKVSGNDNYFLT
jgi:hypothetical protein